MTSFYNAEGRLINWHTGVAGHPFTGELLERYAQQEPMQAAGAALLRLARAHRSVLLDA
jgi:hypothetical protein